MITNYFDENVRLVVTTPGNLAPVGVQRWVYGDNYNLAVYVLNAGIAQPISAGDTLTAILFQTTATLPAQNLAIISPPVVQTDANNNQYFSLNVNLKTTAVAALVQQGTSTTAAALFRLIFSPADGERFSASQDIAVTLISDPTVGASGATPVPPGYPTDPSVFERIANRGIASGYATLDGTGKVPAAQLPASTLGGDMLKSVYDTDGNGVVDTCDSVQSSRVIGLGTAAAQNIPTSGNAATNQVVIGSDTRLSDSRNPVAHAATHNGGSDPIQLASSAATGLCPMLDGSTIQVVGGKLTATTTGNGDMLKSVYDTNNDGIVDNAAGLQGHIVPPSGDASPTQVVLGSDSRLTNTRGPTLHATTHLSGGTDAITLASAGAAGLCPAVDNTTIQISGNKLSAILATASAPGIVRPDGSTITIAGGVISGGGIGAHGARYKLTANTAALTAGTPLQIPWAAGGLEFDTDAYWGSANPTRLSIPSTQLGYYHIGCSLPFTGSSSGAYRQIAIKLNGGSNNYLASSSIGNISNNATGHVSAIWKFVLNDYIEIEVITDGASISVLSAFTHLAAVWLMRIA